MTAELVHAPPIQRRRTVDDLVAEARSRLLRLEPAAAAEVLRAGALLVDIRPHAQRVAEGEIPNALVLERNVLEWRFDPASSARLTLASYDLEIVVVCSEGWTSSLAAASLQSLGMHRATDLAGGFLAWRAAGLPTTAGGTPAGERSGTRPPVLHIDQPSGEVLVRGRHIDLSRQQLKLLSLLTRAGGSVVARDVAAAHIGVSSGRTVDVVVHRLRQRLGAEAATRVVTVRGRGFRVLP